MRKVVVAALLVALVAACDGGSDCCCHKDYYDFGDTMLELYSWLPGGEGLLRQAEHTVYTDAVGELEDFSAPSLQNARVPAPGQDIVNSAMSTRYMSALDLQLFASRFGPDSGVTMYAGAQPKQPGQYVFVSVEHVGDTPLIQYPNTSNRRLQYGVVFKRDGLTVNDWLGSAPYTADTFIGADSWYQVSKDPGGSPVLTHQLIDGSQQIMQTPTGACAIAYGNSVIWMIPKSELPDRNFLPQYSVISFDADSGFGQATGDFSMDTSPQRGDPYASVRGTLAARHMDQVELEVRFVATQLDFANDLGLDFNFLSQIRVDSSILDDSAVQNDTAADSVVRTSSAGGLKNFYNYVPMGTAPGSFFPLAFGSGSVLDGTAAFMRTPGDVGIPFSASRRAKQANDVGIDFRVQNTLATDPTRGDLYGSFMDALQYNSLLQALEANANAKVISVPHVTTLNNQTAAIQSLNYRTPVTNLVPGLSSYFQDRDPDTQDADTGLQLQITPRVTVDGMISLDLRPALAATIRASKDVHAGNEDYGVMLPGIITKDIASMVMVESGETVMINGLLREGQMTVEQGIPWLNQLPVVSPLFSSMKDYTEADHLLILITPHIVRNND